MDLLNKLKYFHKKYHKYTLIIGFIVNHNQANNIQNQSIL